MKTILWIGLLIAANPAWAQLGGTAEPERPWRGLAATMALHGAASGFDAWTSWQRVERNRMLSDGGRFTAESAARKAGWFAGVTVAQALIVKKWGRKHPWVERAFRVANVSLAGSMVSAGIHNLATRR